MADNPYRPPEKENVTRRVPTKTIFLITAIIVSTVTGIFLYRGLTTIQSAQAILKDVEATMQSEEAVEPSVGSDK